MGTVTSIRRLRSKQAAVIMVVLIALLSLVPVHAASPLPNSMAALGDSITRAFNTGSIPFTDAPANSWSTGSNTAVNSLYNRILAQNPTIRNNNFNQAVSGARVRDLPSQVQAAVTRHPDFVTILIGANDVCQSSESAMTSVQTFHDQFLAAMNSLAAGSPQSRIFVLSVPDIFNLWSVLKDNRQARTVWTTLRICQAMLANPASQQPADVERRARVRQRNIDFNTQLQQVCAQFVQCRFDNNAVFTQVFTPADVSTRDFFHPSLSGQAALAAVTWRASGLAP